MANFLLDLFCKAIPESFGGSSLVHSCGLVLKRIGSILAGFFNFTLPEQPFACDTALELFCLLGSPLELSGGISGIIVEHVDDVFNCF